MTKIIGLRIRKDPNVNYIKAESAPEMAKIKIGDFLICQKDEHQDVAEVAVTGEKTDASLSELKIDRLATEADFDHILSLESFEEEACRKCQEEILKLKLEMKLIDAKLTFDQKKLTFYFTSEGRIDFRDLVKSLVASFRKLIRLEQISQRDEAMLLGGIGPCGRRLCCESFLDDHCSVTMDCVRCQNMHNIKSNKVSGYCGKLMCCFGYEAAQYKDQNKGLPEIGEEFMTKEGKGVVIDKKILERKIIVHVDKKNIEVNL